MTGVAALIDAIDNITLGSDIRRAWHPEFFEAVDTILTVPDDRAAILAHLRERIYGARPTNGRATKELMRYRAWGVYVLTHEAKPATVRNIMYRARASHLAPGEQKPATYGWVQRGLLRLRRDKVIPYSWIADLTRWQRKPTTWESPEAVLANVARTYRRDLWLDSDTRVEVFVESDSIASMVWEVTSAWDVPLMVCRGYSSETFAHSAADAWNDGHRRPYVIFIGDLDPDGLHIERTLQRKLDEFCDHAVGWERIGITLDQVEEYGLEGQPAKARKGKPYPYAEQFEAEALPAPVLRELLEAAIVRLADVDHVEHLRRVETEERDLFHRIIEREFAS